MRVNDDYREWNVARQTNDDNSVYAFYKRGLAFRKQHDVLVRHDACRGLYYDNKCWHVDLWRV